MGKIGLKFLLKDGQYLAVGMPLAEARKIVEGLAKPGTLPPVIHGWDDALGGWAISLESIYAAHTFSLEEATTAVGQVKGTSSPWAGRGSGL